MQCVPALRRGKHLPTYSPSMDMGAYVIVINADKVTVTGRKSSQKTYFRHVTGRPGAWTIESFDTLQQVREWMDGWMDALSMNASMLVPGRVAAV